MSVYTRVRQSQLERLLGDYSVGDLEHYEGISAGITNTNYFVDTTLGRWVLTLFERANADELGFYLALMDHLAAQGVPSAHPVTRSDGGFLSQVADKPAALVYRLRGRSPDAPDASQCAAMGGVIAAMHRAARSFPQQRRNSRDLGWVRATRDLLAEKLPADALTLLDEEIAYQQAQAHAELPHGVIHADLFRDNVLFDDGHVCGLIDFYYACHDRLLLDLAVVCNDWCIDDDDRFLAPHWSALSSAYHRRRPYTDAEHRAWPAVLRAAALRFWVSRLHDWHFPRDGHVTHSKDPAPYRRILEAHRTAPPALLP